MRGYGVKTGVLHAVMEVPLSSVDDRGFFFETVLRGLECRCDHSLTEEARADAVAFLRDRAGGLTWEEFLRRVRPNDQGLEVPTWNTFVQRAPVPVFRFRCVDVCIDVFNAGNEDQVPIYSPSSLYLELMSFAGAYWEDGEQRYDAFCDLVVQMHIDVGSRFTFGGIEALDVGRLHAGHRSKVVAEDCSYRKYLFDLLVFDPRETGLDVGMLRGLPVHEIRDVRDVFVLSRLSASPFLGPDFDLTKVARTLGLVSGQDIVLGV